MPQPWVIGHRGASAHAPENTMAAFRRAVDLGARFIETDLHITRDAHLVAIHDSTVDRTTNGTGYVKDHTLEELRALDAGAWFGPAFAGEKIPTLKDVIEFSREFDTAFFLEVKQDAAWGIEHGLVAALRESREADRVVVLSFSPGILRNILRLDRTVMTGLLAEPGGELPETFIEQAQDIGSRQLAPRSDMVTPELVRAAHKKDLKVVCWTVNEQARMRELAALGVDGIMTDYPDRLVSALMSR
jgi:glycerophosphoryl diester phosphodiesterase